MFLGRLPDTPKSRLGLAWVEAADVAGSAQKRRPMDTKNVPIGLPDEKNSYLFEAGASAASAAAIV